jgi:predicted RNA-binding protein with PUA-like domain
MNYWLMKSEPDVFSLEHLQARPAKTATWDGVRNFQARNFLRAMKRGDLAFFYHSSCAEPGVAGVVEIVKEAYPDHTAWDPQSEYYDPRSKPENPTWYMVDVKFVRALKHPVALGAIKASAALKKMPLVQRGTRLSVIPVTAQQWKTILGLEKKDKK